MKEHLWAFGLTEPEAGSDASGTRTRAVLRDGGFHIDGEKCFITNAGTEMSGGVTLTAVTGKQDGLRNEITNMIVPIGTPGYQIGPLYQKMGWKASDTRPLAFEDGSVRTETNILAEARTSVILLQRRNAKGKPQLMKCPYCAASATRKRAKQTELGYATFFCPTCQYSFNERTGTPFNYLEAPTDVVFLVVLWRLRYKLSLRDVAEMFTERGFVFTYETVRDWEARFAPLLADQLRTKRRGQAGGSWYVDETYIKVHGKWCYLYWAIDHDGSLVDSRLSEKRDMDAAKQFFKQVMAVVGHAPESVTTDGHRSYPRAIRETLGNEVVHRTNVYLNNRIEQDHRGIKQRYYSMRGFGSVASAARFCRAFDEVRQYFRPRHREKEYIPLAQQRQFFCMRFAALQELMVAVS